MKKTVGENLKMFRIKKGLSMEEAGKKIGVSAPAILKYERNKIIASLERLEEFAKIYDTTIDEILNIDASINIKYDNIFFKEKTSNIKKENAAETLLMAKGFADPVVSITDGKVDVVINAASITEPQRAQIEDIVKRKTETGAENIVITLLKLEE